MSLKMTRTDYFNAKTKELMEKGYSRKVARTIIKNSFSYKPGTIGKSEFAQLLLRQTRRARDKRLKVPFSPMYTESATIFKTSWVKVYNSKKTEYFKYKPSYQLQG